jgi:hypothetical protein
MDRCRLPGNRRVVAWHASISYTRDMKSFSEQLRTAVRRSEKSQYQIAKETGILRSTLSRFVRGQCGLGMDAIDKLCECIGARLTTCTTPKKE